MNANNTAAWGAPCQHLNGTNCKGEGIYVREMYAFTKGPRSRTSLLQRAIYAVPAQLHEKRHSSLVIRNVIAGKPSKYFSTLPTSKHDTDIHAMKVRNSHL